MQRPKITPLSYFLWKYPWCIWEIVGFNLSLCWIWVRLYLSIDLLFAPRAVICPLQEVWDPRVCSWDRVVQYRGVEKCFIMDKHENDQQTRKRSCVWACLVLTLVKGPFFYVCPDTPHSHHCRLAWAECRIRNLFPFSSSADLLTLPDGLMNFSMCWWPFLNVVQTQHVPL